jgi:hypothetical protein
VGSIGAGELAVEDGHHEDDDVAIRTQLEPRDQQTLLQAAAIMNRIADSDV